jgi:hypothetical protein
MAWTRNLDGDRVNDQWEYTPDGDYRPKGTTYTPDGDLRLPNGYETNQATLNAVREGKIPDLSDT